MNAEFTKERVIDAVNTLSSGNISLANEYLAAFQISNDTWTIAEEILSYRPPHDMHILTFAAMSLAKKIKQSFYSLQKFQLTYLKNSLIDHLKYAAMMRDSNSLIVQLAVGLSALGLLFSQWDYDLQDFVRKLSGKPQHVMALLEVLKIIPEETRPSNLPVEAKKLNSVIYTLEQQSPYILDVLEGILQRPDLPNNTLPKCLAVCASWTKYSMFSPDEVLQHRLFIMAEFILVTPVVYGHLQAAEFFVALLEQSLIRNELNSCLADSVISLKPAFKRAMGERSLLQNYCNIFVNLFHTHFQLTQTNPERLNERLATIELLLLVAEESPLGVIEASLGMWSSISEEVCLQNDPQMYAVYQPYFLRLVELLFPRAALPASYEFMMPPGSAHMQRFRGLIGEVLLDMAHMIDDDTIEKLSSIVVDEQSPWTKVEAGVFFLRHLIGNFKEHRADIILNILKTFFQKDCPQPFIRLQILELISIPKTVNVETIWYCLVNELRRADPMLSAIDCRLNLLMPHWNYLVKLAMMVDEFCLEESKRCDLLFSICTLIRQLPAAVVLEAKTSILNINWLKCPVDIQENRHRLLMNSC
ncbi:transportin-3 [Drosophila sechellia]|uniref:GM21765 n=1 Tax=Drosophila sechellia TaxID=7238 RepID=B4HMJ7_DROSE|nr:transportin-3 [Drosophila sechellia]EDW48265.1 GM21765 [Drosophila sechellia]